jgi:hypothetical protein
VKQMRVIADKNPADANSPHIHSNSISAVILAGGRAERGCGHQSQRATDVALRQEPSRDGRACEFGSRMRGIDHSRLGDAACIPARIRFSGSWQGEIRIEDFRTSRMPAARRTFSTRIQEKSASRGDLSLQSGADSLILGEIWARVTGREGKVIHSAALGILE